MQITVEIPDNIAHRLEQTEENLSVRLLELMVADSYRNGKLNTAEVRQILQLPTRLATHAFLKRMGVYLNYDETEVAHLARRAREITLVRPLPLKVNPKPVRKISGK